MVEREDGWPMADLGNTEPGVLRAARNGDQRKDGVIFSCADRWHGQAWKGNGNEKIRSRTIMIGLGGGEGQTSDI